MKKILEVKELSKKYINKNKIVEAVESFSLNLFENEFAKLKEAIIKEDVNTMKDMMKLSTERRKYFDK